MGGALAVTTADATTWAEANQRHLLAAMVEVRAAMGGAGAAAPPEEPWGEGLAPPALASLCAAFGLSPFERRILVLCAGVELDAGFAGLCATAGGDQGRPYPTFGLALASLADAHWSALSPEGPLRRWRLVEVMGQPATPLTASPLRVDERVLHYLAGVQHLDERLAGLVEPVAVGEALVPSHRVIAERAGAAWAGAAGPPPVVQLCGADGASKRAIVAAACAALGLRLCAIQAEHIPAGGAELEGLARLWEREAALSGAALLVEADGLDPGDARQAAAVGLLLERLAGAQALAVRDRWRPLRRPTAAFDVPRPEPDEQGALWRAALGARGPQLNGRVAELAEQFSLGPAAIGAAAREALAAEVAGEPLGRAVWAAARSQGRARLDDLAQRIAPAAGWGDLVLPEAELRTLRSIAGQVAHRTTVYRDWGFGARASRGLGIGVLFAGASGTGKTLAAEVLAGALELDLYRIDLSGVVSKYIGETEKNLRRVFEAAEEGGAILFFDEADALFGKRGEVKDSHDRYANIEINYLLQRMEAYRGLAVLATNRKGDLDTAFLRRLRFVVNFPFPDLAQRAAIWRLSFPPEAPLDGVDIARLARLSVAGGNIRNIALGAAFAAAAEGGPIGMGHLASAARAEFAKLEKPLNEAELAGWG